MPRIAVIGGGPAGAACALTLARSGIETVLLEAQGPYRDKVCGEALMPGAQRTLAELGLKDAIEAKGRRVYGARAHSRNGKTLEIDVSLLIIPRRQLDQTLRDAAAAKGVEIRYTTPVHNLSIEKRVRIMTKDRTLSADAVVLATGADVRLAKNIGFSYGRAQSVAMRGYARNEVGLATCEFWTGADGTYRWAFPSDDGKLNIGIHRHGSAHPIKREELEAFAREDLKTAVTDVRAWPLRCGLRRRCSQNRVLLIGENAETTYAFTGEGIGPAIESGRSAGITLANAQAPYDERQLRAFDALQSRDRPMQRGYGLLGMVMEHDLGERLLFLAAAKKPKITNAIARGERSPQEFFLPWRW